MQRPMSGDYDACESQWRFLSAVDRMPSDWSASAKAGPRSGITTVGAGTLVLGELTQEEIDAVLAEETLGRIGCHAGGVTYVVPVSYVYDAPNLYILSADGQKLRMMRENPRVCFEVEQITHWANWRTVIAWGTFFELSGADEDAARNLIRSRLTPLIEFESRLSEQEARLPGVGSRATSVYRIELRERTGRFERLT